MKHYLTSKDLGCCPKCMRKCSPPCELQIGDRVLLSDPNWFSDCATGKPATITEGPDDDGDYYAAVDGLDQDWGQYLQLRHITRIVDV